MIETIISKNSSYPGMVFCSGGTRKITQVTERDALGITMAIDLEQPPALNVGKHIYFLKKIIIRENNTLHT